MATKKGPGDRSGDPGKKKPQSKAPESAAAAEKSAKQPEGPEFTIPIGPRPPLPPIIFQIHPAISSLAPPGAVVGTGDLTLNVFGSNFGSGSSVLWNQTALTTTPISSTQLTALVPAADLAAVAQASVTVSNPGIIASISNAFTFNVIPDITSITNQLAQVTANPPLLLTQLGIFLQLQQQQIDNLNSQANADSTTISNQKSQIANQQATITDQQNQITNLTAAVNAAQAQSASPLDVAQSFKSVVDTIQQNAQGAAGLQATVTNMNVQIKSLLNVQAATATAPAKATLIFPSPTALPDPSHLSTLNLSFGSIPNLQKAATPTPTPPTPAPAPPTPAPARPAPAPAPAAGPPPGPTREVYPTARVAAKAPQKARQPKK